MMETKKQKGWIDLGLIVYYYYNMKSDFGTLWYKSNPDQIPQYKLETSDGECYAIERKRCSVYGLSFNAKATGELYLNIPE